MTEDYLSRETLTQKDREELDRAISAAVKTEDDIAMIRARSAYLTHVERKGLDEILHPKPHYAKMTVEALKKIADERNIDITDAKNKAEVVAAIEKADADTETVA